MLLELVKRNLFLRLVWVLVPFESNDLVDNLCIVRIQHLEEIVISHTKHRLEAIY